MTHSQILYGELISFLGDLKASKPNDRTELDRRYAVLITDVEKCISWLSTYIVPLDTRPGNRLAMAQNEVWEQND